MCSLASLVICSISNSHEHRGEVLWSCPKQGSDECVLSVPAGNSPLVTACVAKNEWVAASYRPSEPACSATTTRGQRAGSILLASSLPNLHQIISRGSAAPMRKGPVSFSPAKHWCPHCCQERCVTSLVCLCLSSRWWFIFKGCRWLVAYLFG